MLLCFSAVFAGGPGGGGENGTLHVRITGNCIKCERTPDGTLTISCDMDREATCYSVSGNTTTVGCSCKEVNGTRFTSFSHTGGYDEQKTDFGTIARFSGTKVIE